MYFEDVDYSKIETAHKMLQGLIKGSINIKKEAEFIALGATTDQELCRQAQAMAIARF